MSNHQDSGPLAGWVVALVAGRSFVGKFEVKSGPFGDRRRLDPAYQLDCAWQPVPMPCAQCRGAGGSPLTGPCKACGGSGINRNAPPQMAIARAVRPILTFASWNAIDIPAGSVVRPVSEFSPKERASMAQGVAGAEEMRKAMEADEAGIMLAPPGARI